MMDVLKKKFRNKTEQNSIKTAKRCLLIGINYENTDYSLSGCINDSENLKGFLIKNNYFQKNEFVMMNDKKSGVYYPNKKHIWKQLDALVKFAKMNIKNNVLLFVAYSGHGSHIKDISGDEEDGQDEVLCPVDFINNGYIVDDDIKRKFINKLPKNVKLVTLIDACHSGTVLDLKYNYMVDKKDTYKIYGNMRQTHCEVIMISGCRDSQTSADAYLKDKQEGGKYEYQGAMTAAFISNYKNGITYEELIIIMRSWLKKKKFTQIPQLSSGQYLNTKNNFLLCNFN